MSHLGIEQSLIFSPSGTALGENLSEINVDTINVVDITVTGTISLVALSIDEITSKTPDAGVIIDGIKLITTADAAIITSIDTLPLCIAPTGGSPFILDIPDDTNVGGASRGNYAVDLQMARNASTSVASGENSTLSGGFDSSAIGNYSTVVGGFQCKSIGMASISGGLTNIATGPTSVVFGGSTNNASGESSSMIGCESCLDDQYLSHLAGCKQVTNDTAPCVHIGSQNSTSKGGSIIYSTGSYTEAGGMVICSINSTSAGSNVVTGGQNNGALGIDNGIFCGTLHQINGTSNAIISGNSNNITSATKSVVIGGEVNVISGTSLGENNAIIGGSGNTIKGRDSVIIGGIDCYVSQVNSLAFGKQVKINHSYNVIFADGTSSDFNSTVSNQFACRFAGGYLFTGGPIAFGIASTHYCNNTTSTIGAVNSPLYVIDTITDTTYLLNIDVCAKTATDTAAFKLSVKVKNIAGVITIGAIFANTTSIDATIASASVSVASGGGTLVSVIVSGVAAQTITWGGMVTTIQI